MFPSLITAFSYPTSSSRLNNPSHSALENLQSSTIGQLETVIGLSGSGSTLGTIIGDLRSPASNGGGHVQTANAGGTGQTSYNKGDLLIASSSSVLTKLAIGTDGQVLKADSTQTSGTLWSNIVASKVAVSTSSVVAIGKGASLITLLSATIPGSTLGTNNAIRFNGVISQFANAGVSGPDSYDFNVMYGGGLIANFHFVNSNNISTGGTIEGEIVANGTDSAQVSEVRLTFGNITTFNNGITNNATSIISGTYLTTSSVVSSANQTLSITGQGGGVAQSATSVVGKWIVVEKIL